MSSRVATESRYGVARGGRGGCATCGVLLAGALALTGCSGGDGPGRRNGAEPEGRGKQAAERAVPSASPAVLEGFAGITGPQVRERAAHFSRGALVNLWASWCGSCKKELPMLQQVADAYGPHGLGLITVTADAPEALPKARQLLEGAGLKHEDRYYLAGRVSLFKRALDPRWKGAIPATFLLDGTGEVRYFWNGPVFADEIREVVQRYLAGETVDGMTDVTVGPGR